MRKLCLITILILAINLNVKAPTHSDDFITKRTEQIFKEIDIKKRINLLLKTIKIIESRDNYHLKGLSGEYGAYQFTKSTWKYYSYIFFKELLDIKMPENQDKIAKAKIEMLVRNGFTNEEIAAFWNSGSKNNWETKVGINKYGVKYNVPRYVKDFIKIKNELKV